MLTFIASNQKGLLLSCALGTSMLISAAFHSGCRTGKRSTDVESEGPSATIRLSGLDDDDKGRSDFVYELGECTGGWVGGVLKPDGRVRFQSKGLKSDQTCSLRVRNQEAASDKRFKWVDGNAGTLYAATDVLLKPDVDGTLIGTAALSKNYQIKSSNFFTLAINAAFPEDIRDDGRYTAEISCNPQIKAVGTLTKGSSRQGTFDFEEPINPDVDRKFTCQIMAVWFNQAIRYRGALGTTNSPMTFTAKAGQKLKPQAEAVVLQSMGNEGGGGGQQTTEQIIVNTVEGKCAEGEVFDVKAAKCIKPQ